MLQNNLADSRNRLSPGKMLITLMLFFISFSIAWLYTSLTPEIYRAVATISTSENGKVDENNVEKLISSLEDSSNLFYIVQKHRLYAELSVEGRLRNKKLYQNSPIKIQVENLSTLKAATNIPFAITKYLVIIGEKGYPLNRWVETPYGKLKFTRNPLRIIKNKEKHYFNLIPNRDALASFADRLKINRLRVNANEVYISFEDTNEQRAMDILKDLINRQKKSLIRLRKVLAVNSARFINDKLELTEKTLLETERRLNLSTNHERKALQKFGPDYLKEVKLVDNLIAKTSIELLLFDRLVLYIKSTDNKLFLLPKSVGLVDTSLSSHLMELYMFRARSQETDLFSNSDLLSLTNSNEKKARDKLLHVIDAIRFRLKDTLIKSSESAIQYSHKLQSLTQKEQNLVFLKRQQQINTKIYTYLLQFKEQAALSFITNIDEIKIVRAPKIIENYFWFKNEWIYFFAIIAASLLSIGYPLFYRGKRPEPAHL